MPQKTAKPYECRRLTKSDASELHAFADRFSRYLRGETRAQVSPKLRQRMRALKQRLIGRQSNT